MAAAERDPAVSAIHVVTHSLGGIILRQALTLGVPAKLGRVVMLAPPNRGSAWARRMGPWLGRLVPALPQLSDAPGSLVNRLPAMPSAVQVAVIAAEHDGKCPLATTHLPGQPADVLDDALHRCRKSPPDPTFANPTPDVHGETIHVVVPGRHTFIMYRAATYAAIRAFLQDGSYPPHRPADSVVFGGC